MIDAIKSTLVGLLFWAVVVAVCVGGTYITTSFENGPMILVLAILGSLFLGTCYQMGKSCRKISKLLADKRWSRKEMERRFPNVDWSE